jgi:seryl-tRNA(Sec) selenium transferase
MALAAQHFVPIVELEQAAGKRIVELLKLPADYDAIVTCGAAAGMQSGLAGILTGNNPKFTEQLPDLTGMKSEVIIQRSHRNGFDLELADLGSQKCSNTSYASKGSKSESPRLFDVSSYTTGLRGNNQWTHR